MKSTRINGVKWLVVSVLATVSICGIPQAQGANWQNAGGGWYGIGGNWNPGMPPADGEANFAIGGASTYAVDFFANRSCDSVNVYSQDDVIFDLNGSSSLSITASIPTFKSGRSRRTGLSLLPTGN